ncbi:hypothetical protein ACP4OV_013079 [Aristida adscensionis]
MSPAPVAPSRSTVAARPHDVAADVQTPEFSPNDAEGSYATAGAPPPPPATTLRRVPTARRPPSLSMHKPSAAPAAVENVDYSQDADLLKSYISKIQQLEVQLMRQNFSNPCRNDLNDQLDMDSDIFLNDMGSGNDTGIPDASSEVDEEEKDREHS